jgi:hypothetical protein
VHPELYVGSLGRYGEGQRCLAVIGPMRGPFGEIGKLVLEFSYAASGYRVGKEIGEKAKEERRKDGGSSFYLLAPVLD